MLLLCLLCCLVVCFINYYVAFCVRNSSVIRKFSIIVNVAPCLSSTGIHYTGPVLSIYVQSVLTLGVYVQLIMFFAVTGI